MANTPETSLDGGWVGPSSDYGLMLLADVSGYTEYLRDSELQHAQNVMADLTEVTVDSLTPVFRMAKLEGDAVFAYAMADSVDGSMVLDSIEQTYFAFRSRVRDVDQATTCTCNACRLIPTLDLKFVVHHGEFVVSNVAGSAELTGGDVILVHRLLKNGVQESLGFGAYALLTEACLTTFGMDPATLGLVEHHDEYSDIGEVTSFVEDLTARWKFEEERRQIFVTPAQAEFEEVWTAEVPIPMWWEYFTSPEKRLLWQPDIDDIDQTNPSGRISVGTTNHCKHGKGEVTEEILDWKPYRYYTIRMIVPVIGSMLLTYEFRELLDGRSEMRMRPERIRGWRRVILLAIGPKMRADMAKNKARFFEMVASKPDRPPLEGEKMTSSPSISTSGGLRGGRPPRFHGGPGRI